MKLKEELKMKLRELRNVDNEYEGRLRAALKQLETDCDKYLKWDNGNKEMLAKYSKICQRLWNRY